MWCLCPAWTQADNTLKSEALPTVLLPSLSPPQGSYHLLLLPLLHPSQALPATNLLTSLIPSWHLLLRGPRLMQLPITLRIKSLEALYNLISAPRPTLPRNTHLPTTLQAILLQSLTHCGLLEVLPQIYEPESHLRAFALAALSLIQGLFPLRPLLKCCLIRGRHLLPQLPFTSVPFSCFVWFLHSTYYQFTYCDSLIHLSVSLHKETSPPRGLHEARDHLPLSLRHPQGLD